MECVGVVSQGRGLQRVRPRAARRATQRAAQKVRGRAERRGRRVPPTVAGFEAALHDRGYDGGAEVGQGGFGAESGQGCRRRW